MKFFKEAGKFEGPDTWTIGSTGMFEHGGYIVLSLKGKVNLRLVKTSLARLLPQVLRSRFLQKFSVTTFTLPVLNGEGI